MTKASDPFQDQADREKDAELQVALDRSNAALDQVRKERNNHKARATKLQADLDELKASLDLRATVDGTVLAPPRWTVKIPAKKDAKYHATAWLLFSDWHFDEVVQAPLMNGINAYSREIALKRLRKWAENVVHVAQIQAASFDWDGAVVSMNGDIMNGIIHGFKETNDGDGLFFDIEYWAEKVVAAFELIRSVFPKLAIYVTVGNHGRLSQKWDDKRAVSENIEYLIGVFVRNHYASDPDVTVTLAKSVDLLFPIYNLRVLQTHGNTGGGNGGGGLAGFWPRLARMRLMKKTLYQNFGGFDVMGIGHFHQYKPTAVGYSGFVVNGSGKGYDEYARDMGFEDQPAMQAMIQVTPEKGITAHHPIFVTDRKAEGW